MSPSAVIRSQARQTLKGNYVAAVAAFVILLTPSFIITGLMSIISAVLAMFISDALVFGALNIIIGTPMSILIAVLFSPLLNGYIRLFYQAAFTGEFRMRELFYYYEKDRYHTALLLNLSIIVRLMLPAILFFLPVFFYHLICFGFFSDITTTALYSDFAFILTILSSILLILYFLKYFVVLTLFCTDEQAEPRELIRRSKEIMKDKKPDAIQLIFSFTPWMLLCLLIIPSLYVIPYMTQSLCIGAKWMTLKGK